MLRRYQMTALAILAVTVASLVTGGSILASPVFAQTPGADELAVPDPAPVLLDASTTAFLAIDLLQSTCGQRASCVDNALPVIAAGLNSARTAKVPVVYSVHLAPDNNILTDVAPTPSDSVFAAVPGDKFFDSNLDYILKQAGTKTVVLTGVLSNAGVLYTAAGAIQRGYTVVVAEDGINGATDLATSVALWQMLNGPAAPSANPQNVPLQAKSVTLSRTNLINYK